MARPRTSLIEFKGMTLPVLSVTLHSLHVDALAQAAQKLFGDDAFFDDDAAVLELDKLANDAALEHADWPAISRLLKQHGLRVVGVRGAQESLRESATAAGLPCFAALNRAPPVELPQPAVVSETDSEVVPEATLTSESDAAPESAAAPQNEAAAPPASAPTLVIDRPLRSGQQVYARGGDLVVLAAVNAGAEVIADGHIHIYAPLRGRALAGASGATSARIFTTCFAAELVSIAGLYRTFEAGIPAALAGKPVQIKLSAPADQNALGDLSIVALSTD